MEILTAQTTRQLETTGPPFLVELDGPIPNENVPLLGVRREDAEYKLAQLLATPRPSIVNGQQTEIPVQLVHVSAHSAVGQPGLVEFSKIVLSRVRYRRSLFGRWKAMPVEQFSITNSLLDSVRLDQRVAGSQDRSSSDTLGPMAVLSSCESGALAIEGTLSIAGSLLKSGYRAVLGTETKIGGEVSAEFFRSFYQQLLNGTAVGEAVRRARWELLLSRGHNPLGCVFVLHGDPDLKVSQQEV